MKKSIEEIAQEIKEVIEKDNDKLIYCWNYIYEAEQIKKVENPQIKEEMIEDITEEIECSCDFEIIENLYSFITGNNFPELVAEEIDYTDWNDDWEE